jgi:hypothetical protein
MKNKFQSGLFAVLFLSLVQIPIALSQLGLNPDPALSGQCPGVAKTYTFVNLDDDCGSFNVTVLSGGATISNVNTQNGQFTITVTDSPQNVVVRFSPNGDPDCPTQKDFTIPVLSVSGLQPTISGCPTLFVGKNEAFNLTAQLLYSFNGDNDPDEVQGYQWEFQSGGTGWSISTVNQNGVANSLAQVTTDLGNDAVIRVRGQSLCGGWSAWTTCNIVRAVKAPCPIIGGPFYVVSGVTTPITLLPTIDQELTGYIYNWTYPAGWSGNATGNAATVTPNGINGGLVTLRAEAFGKLSVPCERNIGLDSIVSGIGIFETDVSIQYFPNPVTDNINVVLNGHSKFGDFTIHLINSLGQRLYEAKLTSGGAVNSIYLDKMPAGALHVLITQNDFPIGRFQIIKW